MLGWIIFTQRFRHRWIMKGDKQSSTSVFMGRARPSISCIWAKSRPHAAASRHTLFPMIMVVQPLAASAATRLSDPTLKLTNNCSFSHYTPKFSQRGIDSWSYWPFFWPLAVSKVIWTVTTRVRFLAGPWAFVWYWRCAQVVPLRGKYICTDVSHFFDPRFFQSLFP